MNLDELQSVQARERQSSDLQHLRASFYQEVGEFVRELTAERAEAVEAADDPFASPEVRRLSDDIETAEQTVEAIYERRVGKVVKKASIAAAGMPVDHDGLTDEEAALFDDLVARIEANRENVLAILDGDPPTESGFDRQTSAANAAGAAGPSEAADADPDEEVDADDTTPEGLSAADLMGDAAADLDEGPDTVDASETVSGDTSESSAGDAAPPEPPTPEPDEGSETAAPPDEAGGIPPGAAADGKPGAAGEGTAVDDATADGDDEPAASDDADVPGLPRTTVRITADVGEVVGADDRDYDLSAEDVVTLPEPNADVLVDKDAAERLE